MMKRAVGPRRLNVGYQQAWLQYIISSLLRGQKVWDTSSKFSRGVPALKMVPGVPVKMKVQGEHVSVQSTKHGKIAAGARTEVCGTSLQDSVASHVLGCGLGRERGGGPRRPAGAWPGCSRRGGEASCTVANRTGGRTG
ncbi:hypothetical protein Taro_001257 [Colocasia esculenta]|uniref:Uncharacterized protein n=1 Tax=Colocasia esculenta TaxID=4460 RepID=A0A843TFE7_COLES|nr:hypothetical protein [Colocasia esculenta]